MKMPLFAVAKVIPDMTRMEPRNFGVIVWNRGACKARFIGEKMDIDSRHLPRLELTSKDAYFEWIQYWNLQINKTSIRLDSGEVVDRESHKFIDALCEKSLENFQLIPSGFIRASVPKTKTMDLVESLYESVVITPKTGTPNQRKYRMQMLCEKLFSPLSNNPNFHSDLAVPCKNLETQFPFSYGFGEPEHPQVLIQSVSIGKEDQVNAAAMKFRCVTEDEGLIDKHHCACLVDTMKNSSVSRSQLSFLSRYSEIVSLSDLNQASATLSQMGLPLLSML